MQILSKEYSPCVKLSFEEIADNPEASANPLLPEVLAVAASTRERISQTGGFNESRPSVSSVHVLSGGDISQVNMQVWAVDWAFTYALRQVAQNNPSNPATKLAPFGGSISVSVILLCNEGVILSKRSIGVAISPGKSTSTVTEGTNDDDLKNGAEGVFIDGHQAAQRGIWEEVGLNIELEDIKPTVFFGFGEGRGYSLSFAVDTGLPFAEIVKAHASAIDAEEGALTLFSREEGIEVAKGSSVSPGTSIVLSAALDQCYCLTNLIHCPLCMRGAVIIYNFKAWERF